MSDQTMIERMGRAIFSYDVHYRSRGGDVWETAPSDHRDRCLKQARLVLTAMREPTKAMASAGSHVVAHIACWGDASGPAPDSESIPGAIETYHAMIDAALLEAGDA